jgi:hypothetical protein
MWRNLSASSQVIILPYSGFILLALISTIVRFSPYMKTADELLFPYGYGVLDLATLAGFFHFSAVVVWGGIEYKKVAQDKNKAQIAKSKIVCGVLGLALVVFVGIYIGILFSPLIPPPQ